MSCHSAPAPIPSRRHAHEPPRRTLTIALAGNPNSGKTTLFNNLTGSHQRVGNYPGVTVEIKEGALRVGDTLLRIVDLPGAYSLTAYSAEEIVARDFIINHQPDVVVNVVDGANLERNLYLTLQLAELGRPLVLALNMYDEMAAQGLAVNLDLLAQRLHAPIIPTVGTRKKGMKQLLDAVFATADTRAEIPGKTRTAPPLGELSAYPRTEGVPPTSQEFRSEYPPTLTYDADLEAALEELTAPIAEFADQWRATPADARPAPQQPPLPVLAAPRWVALKLLENDPEVLNALPGELQTSLRPSLDHLRRRLFSLIGDDPETRIAEHRYGHVRGLTAATVRRAPVIRLQRTDRIDSVLTHRLLGLPIFAALMYLTFYLVFTLGAAPVAWIESALEFVTSRLDLLWPAGRLPLLQSLIRDGIVAGVGNVIVFLPNVVLLFAAISLLEDTGYMARAAFLMDRLMKWVGLHGKSFIPMLTGFGCTVPAILATRVLETRRDRLTTIMVLPLMSCGARMPIYAVILPAFLPRQQAATATFALYVIGVLLAILTARFLRSTVFRGQPSPFVMELPPYRLPTFKAICLHVWQRARLYLKKAGTLILGFSVLMWALTTFPRTSADPSDRSLEQVTGSYAGQIGRAIEPAFKPLGFDWRITTGLVAALPAKELFVTQLAIVYSATEPDTTATPDTTRTAPPMGELSAYPRTEGVPPSTLCAIGPTTAHRSPSGELSAYPRTEGAPPNTMQATNGTPPNATPETHQDASLRQQLANNYNPLIGFCVCLFCLIAIPCMATVAATRKETNSWFWATTQFLGLTLLAWLVTFLTYQAGHALQLGT